MSFILSIKCCGWKEFIDCVEKNGKVCLVGIVDGFGWKVGVLKGVKVSLMETLLNLKLINKTLNFC